MPRRFTQVDVFTDELGYGNPVAVVHDAEGLDDEHAAAVRGLDEPVGDDVPAAADRPGRRLPRPDLHHRPRAALRRAPDARSARAWLEAGGTPAEPDVVVQECGAGLVRVRRDGGRLAFAAPPLLRAGRSTPTTSPRSSRALGVDPARGRRRAVGRQRARLGRGAARQRRDRARAGAGRARWRASPTSASPARTRRAARSRSRSAPSSCRRRRRGPGDRQPQRRARPLADRDRAAPRARTSPRRAPRSAGADGSTSTRSATTSGSAATRSSAWGNRLAGLTADRRASILLPVPTTQLQVPEPDLVRVQRTARSGWHSAADLGRPGHDRAGRPRPHGRRRGGRRRGRGGRPGAPALAPDPARAGAGARVTPGNGRTVTSPGTGSTRNVRCPGRRSSTTPTPGPRGVPGSRSAAAPSPAGPSTRRASPSGSTCGPERPRCCSATVR